MARVDDMPRVLNEFVEEFRFKEFEWGVVDCTQNAAEWAYRVTGVRPYPELQPYSTEIGGTKAMLAIGYKSMADAVDAIYSRIDLKFVARGDLVLCKANEEADIPTSLGVCCGEVSAFVHPGVTGMVFIATTDCNVAWRIE